MTGAGIVLLFREEPQTCCVEGIARSPFRGLGYQCTFMAKSDFNSRCLNTKT